MSQSFSQDLNADQSLILSMKKVDERNFVGLLTAPLHQQRVLEEKEKPKIRILKSRIPTETVCRCNGGGGGGISFLHRYHLSREGAADLCS